MIRPWRRRAGNVLAAGLGVLSRWPRLAFAVTDAAAAAMSLARRGAYPGELRALFPELTPAGRKSAARAIRKNQSRRLLLQGWAERAGVAALRPLVRANGAIENLRPPLILATFHVGPLLALTAVAERLDGEVLTLRSRVVGSGRAEHVSVEAELESEEQRAAAFLGALTRLRRGSFVFMAVDPLQHGGLEVPFLGRTLRLARGAFALSRMTGAPIVPLAARWNGNEVEIESGAPLSGSDEQMLAAVAARWLEAYLARWPGELSQQLVALLRTELIDGALERQGAIVFSGAGRRGGSCRCTCAGWSVR